MKLNIHRYLSGNIVGAVPPLGAITETTKFLVITSLVLERNSHKHTSHEPHQMGCQVPVFAVGTGPRIQKRYCDWPVNNSEKR